MRFGSASLAAALVVFSLLACTNAARGQISALHVVSQPTPADVLPGYVANDVLLDFDGRYFGSQMIIELTSGEIYQNVHAGRPGNAAHTPPASFLLTLDPTMAWDTFLANGGTTAEDTIGSVGFAGAAIHIESANGARDSVFSDAAADIAWFANLGDDVIADEDGFMVARITLSDDASGTFQYYGGVGGVGQPSRVAMLPIRDGFITPEPSSVVLLGLGAIGLGIFTRRRG